MLIVLFSSPSPNLRSLKHVVLSVCAYCMLSQIWTAWAGCSSLQQVSEWVTEHVIEQVVRGGGGGGMQERLSKCAMTAQLIEAIRNTAVQMHVLWAADKAIVFSVNDIAAKVAIWGRH